MKLCRDCKYFRRDVPFFWIMRFAKCAYARKENGSRVDLVGGGKFSASLKYASVERMYDDIGCGPSAQNFEPK